MLGIVSRSRYALSPQIMALILIAVSILGGLASWINLSHGVYRVGYDNKPLGVSVAYSSQSSQDPEFTIIIKDRGGRPLKTIYSVYMWMPGGEIESLGIYGGSEVIKINYSVVRDFSRKWHDYIVSRNSDPGMVQPGLILMGAVHEKEGVYDSLRGVPINTKEILGNKSVVVEITEDLGVKKPLVKINQTSQSIGGSGKNLVSVGIDYDRIKTQDQWPPGIIGDTRSCYTYTDPATGNVYYHCYWWKLVKNYSVNGAIAPIEATYVYGSSADKVGFVDLYAVYRSSSSVGIDFMIAASVEKSGGSIDYEIIGTSFELIGDNIWLNADYILRNGLSFVSPATLGLGFEGDMAFARYDLYLYVFGPGLMKEYAAGETANMTLMRPIVSNNVMKDHILVGGDPYSGSGIIEEAFRYYRDYWQWSDYIRSQNYVTIDVFKVLVDTDTLYPLSASVNVLAIVCAIYFREECGSAMIPMIFGASVGATYAQAIYMDLKVTVALKADYVNSGYDIVASYFYSPGTLLYNGNSYYIGSLYIDAHVFSPNDIPILTPPMPPSGSPEHSSS